MVDTAPPTSSLLQKLSLTIWGLFLTLLLLLCLLGYTAMQAAADWIVPQQAQQTIALRAQAAEGLFLQAEASVRRLRLELLDRLERASTPRTLERFDALFQRSSDGLWRVRPALVDPIHAPTLYLHQGQQGLDASARLRAVVSYDMLREQGPALAPPFFSVYMDFVEDGLMVYARGIDWGSGADASATNTGYPTMQGADPHRNPERRIFWTPVYLDKQANTWMVSVIDPLDWKGQWAGTLGHDVSIQTLIDTVGNSRSEDGYQLILSADGNLISHPDLRERIASADGQLQIATLKDPILEQVYDIVRAAGSAGGAGLTPDGKHWVAWSRIRGPDWDFVYVLPQARVNRVLMWGLASLFAIGAVGLFPAIWLLRRQVRRLIALPLQRVTQAVDAFGRGKVPAPIALGSNNELGRLAGAFDGMVAELVQQRAAQTAQAQTLQTEVNERRLTTQRLEDERARMLALLGAMDLGIIYASAEGEISYCNQAFRNLWHVTQDTHFIGRTEHDVFIAARAHAENPHNFALQMQKAQDSANEAIQFEFKTLTERFIHASAHPVRNAEQRLIGRLWLLKDVTHERQTAEQLIFLAERDSLTGLYNRHRFEDELSRFFKGSRREVHQAALLFFDLDEFKYINDTFGHRAGDQVLMLVAAEVRAMVRDTDTLCRLGGDEFAVLMPHAAQEEAQRLAERIVRAISQKPLPLGEQTLRLTTSLGIAHYPDHASTPEELVTHADAAMYQAKRLGKNRWRVYRPDRDVSQEMVSRMAWNDRIDRALDKQLLRLHFQGIYHAEDQSLAHLEALVRMVDENDPTRLIPPGQFIVPAEKTGKILDIDRWVIRESIHVLANHPDLPAVAINISGRSFDDPELAADIARQLQSSGVAPHRLWVELTETAAVSDLRDAERFIDALRHSGCTICLDDFGTGFASFAYLKHLKADVLKIDGLFVRNLPNEPDNQVFVRSIIEVARGMGKQTVAEFVENEASLNLLRSFGVDMVQGYFLDQPQPDHPALARQTPA